MSKSEVKDFQRTMRDAEQKIKDHLAMLNKKKPPLKFIQAVDIAAPSSPVAIPDHVVVVAFKPCICVGIAVGIVKSPMRLTT